MSGGHHWRVAARFECVTDLPMTPAEAFDLSLSVEAHLESMASSGERAEGDITTGTLRLGDEVTWRAWHFGVPWRLTSRITTFERSHRFVDEQVRGPFRRFRHEHLFTATGDGTRMVDVVEFEAPAGVAGRIAERLVLARYLRRLIEVRNQYLAGHQTSGGAQPVR